MTTHNRILDLDRQTDDCAVAIRCRGELDLSVCDELKQAIDRSYAPDLAALKIDMTGLTFIDSSGLACILQTADHCRRLGVTLEVIPSRPVARLFALAGVDRHRVGTARDCLADGVRVRP
jgi:anti-anti-sigma factor